eukprot:GILJ01001337.1.p1 GENE.GILJ01001337.1~~GILJ01001337.1.p1  ORF type:complete len:422 (+),score=56.29 GILJ01001337.1:71-1336(+)
MGSACVRASAPEPFTPPKRTPGLERRRLSILQASLNVMPASGQPEFGNTGKAHEPAKKEMPKHVRRMSTNMILLHATDSDGDASGGLSEHSTAYDMSKEVAPCPTPTQSLAIAGIASKDDQAPFSSKVVEFTIDGEAAPIESWSSSRLGYVCQKGLKPEMPNQDDFAILEDYEKDCHFYGVFDGHGQWGHQVANYVRRHLPKHILEHEQLQTDTQKAILDGFAKTNDELNNDSLIDTRLSGCTVTVAVRIGKILYTAGVGDSRAVLGRVKSHGSSMVTAVDLTIDHKCSIPEEQKRIQNAGGEVYRAEMDLQHRVYVRGCNYPGLAVTRAFGDTIAAAVGVIAVPTIKVVELKERDKFLVLASDGVWEFINSQSAIDLVRETTARVGIQKAAEDLFKESKFLWMNEEDVVDDITAIIIQLH